MKYSLAGKRARNWALAGLASLALLSEPGKAVLSEVLASPYTLCDSLAPDNSLFGEKAIRLARTYYTACAGVGLTLHTDDLANRRNLTFKDYNFDGKMDAVIVNCKGTRSFLTLSTLSEDERTKFLRIYEFARKLNQGSPLDDSVKDNR